MKHHIKDGDRLIATIETHGEAIVVVHEPEIKPVQFADEMDTFIECTPEQRAEIIRIAREFGRKLFFHDIDREELRWPNLYWRCNDDALTCTSATKDKYPDFHWLSFDEFVARLKGEWVEQTEEPAQMNYSHLIGKWVMRIGFSSHCYTQWKWYKVVSDENPATGIAIIDCDNYPISCYESFVAQFDLTNPLDYNPDEVERIIPFDIERWRSGDFVRVQTRDGRLPDKFNEVEQLKEYDCILTPLVGIIKGHTGVSCWGYNGKYGNLSEEHSHDLVLVVKGEGGGK